MNDCPHCGFPFHKLDMDECPKCDDGKGAHAHPSKSPQQGILEIDIAHSGESWEMAKQKIERSLDDALYYKHSALKVIHGYGSSTGGESVIGPRAKAYLRHLAELHGGRFAPDRQTSGASLIWLNK